jgi:hypothetical protein
MRQIISRSNGITRYRDMEVDTLRMFHLDELDLEFILCIQTKLEKHFQDRAPEVLIKSRFLKRLQQTPDYVYHYDEHYWVDFIRNEHEANKEKVTT